SHWWPRHPHWSAPRCSGYQRCPQLLNGQLSRVVADYPGGSICGGGDPLPRWAGWYSQPAPAARATGAYPALRAPHSAPLALWERVIAGQGAFEIPYSGGAVDKAGSLIYLDGITVSFDGFQALREVDFYVDRGELRALIGPNGAGKTTLLDAICGKVKPD